MAYARIGLSRVSAWSNNDENYINYDLRKPAMLEFTDETITEYRGREIPNYTKAKLTVPTFNIGRPLLYYLNQQVYGGTVAIEAVAAKNGVSTYDGVFRFDTTGSKAMGIDYTYTISDKERVAEVVYEARFSKKVAQEIIASGSTYSPKSAGVIEGGSSNIGTFTQAHYYNPSLNTIKFKNDGAGAYTVLVQPEDVISRKLELKTEGRKTIDNRTVVDYIVATVEYEIAAAQASSMSALHQNDITDWAPEIVHIENNPTGTESHVFENGVLSWNFSATVGDDARNIKMKFTGKIPIYNISYDEPTNTYTYSL